MARSTARRRSSCIATSSPAAVGPRWPSPGGSAKPTRVCEVTDFMDVADRVWVARYEWADANVTAIGSERGLVVVDTHGSPPAGGGGGRRPSTSVGRCVLSALARLGAGPVAAVVNTHWHWDHSFGNAAFRERDPAV